VYVPLDKATVVSINPPAPAPPARVDPPPPPPATSKTSAVAVNPDGTTRLLDELNV